MVVAKNAFQNRIAITEKGGNERCDGETGQAIANPVFLCHSDG